MKVFLDECIDWRLSRDLVGHKVRTARQMGWTAVNAVAASLTGYWGVRRMARSVCLAGKLRQYSENCVFGGQYSVHR